MVFFEQIGKDSVEFAHDSYAAAGFAFDAGGAGDLLEAADSSIVKRWRLRAFMAATG